MRHNAHKAIPTTKTERAHKETLILIDGVTSDQICFQQTSFGLSW